MSVQPNVSTAQENGQEHKLISSVNIGDDADRDSGSVTASASRQPSSWLDGEAPPAANKRVHSRVAIGAGIINDIKSRLPWYKSDWTDAWNYRVVPATALIFFAK